jgi:hypothetical protein
MPSATYPDSQAQPAAGSARTGPPGPGRDDPVLLAERAYLRSSREFLRLMRDDVLSLRALAGDRVSQEYLKADLYRRAEALIDLPDTPLFFGRLDYAGSAGGRDDPASLAGERFHIGRRHVHDADGRPVVIDWRAPVSRPFYRASPAEPMGLALRRRFGFAGGELTAYEDEDFAAPRGPAATGPAASRILIEEIERPRSGPMRDIVATIQPDQDDIVRLAPARRPSACTASPTCCTRTPSGCAAAGSWSSDRTGPSSPTSAMSSPRSASWTSPSCR